MDSTLNLGFNINVNVKSSDNIEPKKDNTDKSVFRLGIDQYSDEELKNMPYFGQLGIGRDVRKAAVAAGMLQKTKIQLNEAQAKAQDAGDDGMAKEIDGLLNNLDSFGLVQLRLLYDQFKGKNLDANALLDITKFAIKLKLDKSKETVDKLDKLGLASNLKDEYNKNSQIVDNKLPTANKKSTFSLMGLVEGMLNTFGAHLNMATSTNHGLQTAKQPVTSTKTQFNS